MLISHPCFKAQPAPGSGVRRAAAAACLLVGGLMSGSLWAAAPPPADAEANYQRVCGDCHDKGAKEKLAKGAPRLGDYKAWESRLSKGVDTLYGKLIDGTNHGKPDDPVWQKTNPFIWRDDLTDVQIRGALEYMFMKADE